MCVVCVAGVEKENTGLTVCGTQEAQTNNSNNKQSDEK